MTTQGSVFPALRPDGESGDGTQPGVSLPAPVLGGFGQPSRELAAVRRAPVLDRVLKRTVDLLGSVFLMVIAAPVMMGTAILIVLFDHQSPLFVDRRIGRHGNQFPCVKFRTMRNDPLLLERYFAANPWEAEAYRLTRKLDDDPRITHLGRFLRKTSIDELPQLLNVFIGHMSLVGPRPIAPGEFAERGPSGEPLTLVRPGLTGLWQVSGRSELSHRNRIRLDNFYALHWTFWLDLRLLVATPIAVLFGKGAR